MLKLGLDPTGRCHVTLASQYFLSPSRWRLVGGPIHGKCVLHRTASRLAALPAYLAPQCYPRGRWQNLPGRGQGNKRGAQAPVFFLFLMFFLPVSLTTFFLEQERGKEVKRSLEALLPGCPGRYLLLEEGALCLCGVPEEGREKPSTARGGAQGDSFTLV